MNKKPGEGGHNKTVTKCPLLTLKSHVAVKIKTVQGAKSPYPRHVYNMEKYGPKWARTD